MSLSDKVQVVRFLAQLLRPGADSRPDPRVQETQESAPGGARFDLYLPSAGARGAVVAVHGGDRQGWKNGRLVAFARALARCQVACVVPEVAGLARCAFDLADLDALEQVCSAAEQRLVRRVGLVGFSYGGGYALSLAARPALASLRFVVAVGAFADLPSLFDWYAERDRVPPRTREEWDDAIYLRLVLAYWFRAALGVPDGLCADVESLLDRYCEQASPEEKRSFYEQHLRRLEVFAVAAKAIDRDLLALLSPAGKMAQVRCPVTLIHDRFDSIVPEHDARRLYDELTRAGGGPHRLVVTEVLSHVTPTRALDLVGLARLASALEPLVSQE